MRIALALVALAPLLTGCISLLPKQPPPPKVFTLEAASAQPATTMVKPIVLAVDEPTTARALNGSDIAWTKEGQLAYASGAAWAGRAPDLLQTVLLYTIDRSGLVTGAVRAGAGRADAEIVWDVSSFGVNEDGALEARLSGRAKLFAARNRLMLSSMEFDERVPLRDRTARSAAAALQQAAQNASGKIARWAAEQTPAAARGGATRGDGELSGEPAPGEP